MSFFFLKKGEFSKKMVRNCSYLLTTSENKDDGLQGKHFLLEA